MWPNPLFPEDLVTFTEEILNGKLHFLCSEILSITVTFSNNSKIVQSGIFVCNKYKLDRLWHILTVSVMPVFFFLSSKHNSF